MSTENEDSDQTWSVDVEQTQHWNGSIRSVDDDKIETSLTEKQKREEKKLKEKCKSFQIYFDTQLCTINTKSIEELKKNCSNKLLEDELELIIQIVKTHPSNGSSTILFVSFMSYTIGRW
jgi:hypothetical protein